MKNFILGFFLAVILGLCGFLYYEGYIPKKWFDSGWWHGQSTPASCGYQCGADGKCGCAEGGCKCNKACDCAKKHPSKHCPGKK